VLTAVLKVIACAALLPLGTAAAQDAALAALRGGGHVLIMRHSTTVPGVGDPSNFRLGDCATQRNLSDEGRVEATRFGARLRDAGIGFERVLSSAWCRCEETARLAFGSAEPWPPLNSFFNDRSTAEAQTAQIRSRVAGWKGPGNLALVTHQVNIQALTGEPVRQGEAMVLRPATGGFQLVGRIAP